MSFRPSRTRGFTLTEMAVVLVIVALMIGGLLVPLSTQRNVEARRDTGRALENIREALLGFAITHGRLPCPAARGIASGSAQAGVEMFDGSSCTCTAGSNIAANVVAACTSDTVTGAMPWASLGLQETDGWNNRYTYLVTANYARAASGQTVFNCDGAAPATPPANAAFALCTRGLANAYSAADLAIRLTTSNEVPAIVVSHGDNGLGAWQSDGSQHGGAAGDELANADGDANFVSNANIDDQVVWISRSILMNRMIATGKLP